MVLCRNCNVWVEPKITPTGPHLKADCPLCGKYIKFLPQSIHASEWVMPYGKYKGQTLGWIKTKDYPYLKWLIGNAQSRIRDLVAEVIMADDFD